jgi:hypothetical protein
MWRRGLGAMVLLVTHMLLTSPQVHGDTSWDAYAGPYAFLRELSTAGSGASLGQLAFGIGMLSAVWGSFTFWAVRGGCFLLGVACAVLAGSIFFTMWVAAIASC